MRNDRITHDVDEKPSLAMSFALAMMHVLIIFDGIVFIPNVLGKTLDIPSDTLRFVTFGTLIVAAVFTFLQSRRYLGIGAGFILFTGSYSAFLVCSMDAVKMGGFATLATLSILTAPVIFLYTYFIRFFRHIITPAVGGVVILLVAVSLVPIGLDLWAGSGNGSASLSLPEFGVGSVTILILTLLMLFGNTLTKLWSPLLALIGGYIAAFFTGQLHFEHALSAPWLGLPPMAWPGLELNIGAAHLPLIFAFSMAMVASMIENTGNIMLVQQISKRDFRRISYDQVQGGLYCDGLSKIAGGLMGTAVPSIYCDNLPLIQVTGVASRRVGACGGVVLLVLAFMPKVSGFVLDMPAPVIGGFLLVIASLLFHAGIGLVTMNKFSGQHGLILGLSLTMGLVAEQGSYFQGIFPDAMAPVLQNSVAVGGFTAFFLSTLAYIAPKKSLHATFKAHPEEYPKLKDMITAGRDRMKLSPETYNRLSLCCEEVFMHMASKSKGDDCLTIRISRTDEGYFTEVICGYQMDDINNFYIPESFYHATTEELEQLGMVLFSQYARDVKHIEISGYSFISFMV